MNRTTQRKTAPVQRVPTKMVKSNQKSPLKIKNKRNIATKSRKSTLNMIQTNTSTTTNAFNSPIMTQSFGIQTVTNNQQVFNTITTTPTTTKTVKKPLSMTTFTPLHSLNNNNNNNLITTHNRHFTTTLKNTTHSNNIIPTKAVINNNNNKTSLQSTTTTTKNQPIKMIQSANIMTKQSKMHQRSIKKINHISSVLFSTSPDVIDITYVEPSGEAVPLRISKAAHPDDSLMTLAVKNQVDMEGSCDGQLACSTCHCILSQEDYDAFMKLKPPTDEELDMLDTAFGLTSTSRLGCQIPVNMLEKNITLTLPKFTR